MIIKSFYRRKSTKIYFILISLISFFILSLCFYIHYLNSIVSNNDRLIYFKNATANYELEDACTLVNIKSSDLKIYLEEYELSNRAIMKMMPNLAENNVVINLENKIDLTSFKKSIIIYNQNKQIELNIQEINQTGNYNYLYVSKKIFYELWDKKTYCVDEKKYKNDGTEITILENTSYEEESKILDIKKKIQILKVFLCFVIITSLVILITIIKNILFDLKKERELLYILGIRRLTIFYYNFIRMISLFILPLIFILISFIKLIFEGRWCSKWKEYLYLS